LSNKHEAGNAKPWKVSDAPVDYIKKLIGAIMGLEIDIDQLDGKWKLDQNKQAVDREGVAQGLAGKSDAQAQTLSELMKA
jgi:transcriptional regulator